MSLVKLLTFILRLFRRIEKHHVIYPKSYDDILEILRQAKDNGTSLKVTGGTFPISAGPKEIVIDIQYINRLVGLDIYQKRVVVESGMRLSTLNRILESVNLSLDLQGRVPDLTLCDAIAAGVFGGSSSLMSIVVSAEVCLANGRLVSWTWDKDPAQMKALCCGLGMIAVVLSLTLKCVPLQRYTEISYLCSIRDVLESFDAQCKSSLYQQLQWFPFSELIVMTHINPADKMQLVKQPLTSMLFERLSYVCSHLLRIASQTALPQFPWLAALLGRVQFFSLWSVAKHRSDFSHSPIHFWPPEEACRGVAWLLPLDGLPDVLNEVFQWAQANPQCCVSPLFIQSSNQDRSGLAGKSVAARPYLLPAMPNANRRACSLWYDWFVPEGEPDPISVHDFEEIFLSAGGVRCWSGERITSPLVLTDVFPYYRKWCKVKADTDPDMVLSSAYVQGTVFSASALTSRTRGNWSECSSLCGSVSSLIM